MAHYATGRNRSKAAVFCGDGIRPPEFNAPYTAFLIPTPPSRAEVRDSKRCARLCHPKAKPNPRLLTPDGTKSVRHGSSAWIRLPRRGVGNSPKTRAEEGEFGAQMPRGGYYQRAEDVTFRKTLANDKRSDRFQRENPRQPL